MACYGDSFTLFSIYHFEIWIWIFRFAGSIYTETFYIVLYEHFLNKNSAIIIKFVSCLVRCKVIPGLSRLITTHRLIIYNTQIVIFNRPNPCSRVMALGSTHPVTEINTRNLPEDKRRHVLKSWRQSSEKPMASVMLGSIRQLRGYASTRLSP
jgi:hypothetical protein